MPSLIEIGWLVLEKKIIKNLQCIITYPWARGFPFISTI
jgi:hypothetical protein